MINNRGQMSDWRKRIIIFSSAGSTLSLTGYSSRTHVCKSMAAGCSAIANNTAAPMANRGARFSKKRPPRVCGQQECQRQRRHGNDAHLSW